MKSGLKNNFKNIHLLTVCTLVLCAICFLSVYSPIRFERERAQREQAVKQRLVRIRTAAEAYKARHGVYADRLDKLVHAGLLPDSLQRIPYADGKRFSLFTTTITGKSGRHIPLMECSAGYADYLQGLDPDAVAALTGEANQAGRFAGLKIGDLAAPNNNAGNWE